MEEQKEIVPTMETQVNLERQPETEEVIPVSEGDSRTVEDEFINLETTGLRRSQEQIKVDHSLKDASFQKYSL